MVCFYVFTMHHANIPVKINNGMLWCSCTVGYRLVIICSKEDDKHCHMIKNLHAYLRTTPDVQSDSSVQYLQSYLTSKFRNPKYSQLGVPQLLNCAIWKDNQEDRCDLDLFKFPFSMHLYTIHLL